MLNKFTENLTAIRAEIDNQNINYYINFIVSALFEANKYFNDQEPWKKKDDKDRLNTIVYTSLEMIRKISFMLYPIIPSSIEKALKIFNLDIDAINFESIAKHDYAPVTHVDGTARVQVVKKDCESIFRKVIEEYYEKTGVPMLLNTSLNIRGRPMVNDEKDARLWEQEYKVKVF